MGFDVLSVESVVEPRIVIEASAGTGKTFTIEHLFIRRLLESADISCSDFAVITFTRACAKDLKVRIRKTLDQAVLFAEGKEEEKAPEYMQKYMHSGEIRKRLRQARIALDRCIISTIHGFCIQILLEYEGRKEGNWIEESESARILYEIIQNELGDFLSPIQWYKVFKSMGHDRGSFLHTLQEKLWKRSSQPKWSGFSACANALLNQVCALGYNEERVLFLLETISHNFQGLYNKSKELHESVAEQFSAFAALFREEASEGEVEHFLSCCFLFSDLFSSPKVKPQNNSQDAREFLKMAKLLFDPLIEALISPEALMDQLAATIRPRFCSLIRNKGFFHFEDFVEQVLERLNDDRFKTFLQQRFHTVIVDEFQDTDPVQWKILSTIFDHSWNGHLYLVGDPKQAIYAFRDADVYCYMEAKRVLAKEPQFLLKNFRSTSAAIDAQNALFCAPHADGLFFLPRLAITVRPQPLLSCARVQDLNIDDKKAIHFFVVRGALQKKRNWPTEEVEDILFHWIAQEIAFLIKNGIAIQEIAVLIKDRHQALRLQEVLDAHEIASISWCVHSVMDTAAYFMLHKLCMALVNPLEKGLLIDLFSSDPFFYSEEECRKMTSQSSPFVSLRDVFEEHGVGALFKAFFSHTNTQKKLDHASTSFRRDMDQLFEILMKNEHAFVGSAEQLLDFVNSLDEEGTRDRYVICFPQRDAVQILTVHKSKGLEFDIVFALGQCFRSQQEANIDHREYDQEKIRQFYVASTRAKRRTYIPVPIDTDQKVPPTGTKSSVELFLEHVGSCTLLSEESIRTALEALVNASSNISVTF